MCGAMSFSWSGRLQAESMMIQVGENMVGK